MPGVFHTTTLQEIASWPKPNYVDPVERTWLPPYAITLCAVGCVFTAGRIYLRSTKRPSAFGWDDAAIIIACVRSFFLPPSRRYGLFSGDMAANVRGNRNRSFLSASPLRRALPCGIMMSVGTCGMYGP